MNPKRLNQIENEFRQTQLEMNLQSQMKSQMQLDLEAGFREEYELNQYLIEERTNEIEKIRCDSQVLNEIMLDLAEMVNNQGEWVDKISEDVNKAKQKTEKALNEIKKTEKYREEACCSFCHIC